MERKYFADIVINKEELSDSSRVFVVHCVNLGIVSQGDTMEEAMKNIKEAIELYLEEQPEDYQLLNVAAEPSLYSVIEVKKDAETTSSVRQKGD